MLLVAQNSSHLPGILTHCNWASVGSCDSSDRSQRAPGNASTLFASTILSEGELRLFESSFFHFYNRLSVHESMKVRFAKQGELAVYRPKDERSNGAEQNAYLIACA